MPPNRKQAELKKLRRCLLLLRYLGNTSNVVTASLAALGFWRKSSQPEDSLNHVGGHRSCVRQRLISQEQYPHHSEAA
jgi:hypothetical protein